MPLYLLQNNLSLSSPLNKGRQVRASKPNQEGSIPIRLQIQLYEPYKLYNFINLWLVLMALLSCPNYRPGPSLRHISGERLFVDRFILLKSADKCNSYRQKYTKKWYYCRKKRTAH